MYCVSLETTKVLACTGGQWCPWGDCSNNVCSNLLCCEGLSLTKYRHLYSLHVFAPLHGGGAVPLGSALRRLSHTSVTVTRDATTSCCAWGMMAATSGVMLFANISLSHAMLCASGKLRQRRRRRHGRRQLSRKPTGVPCTSAPSRFGTPS